MSFLLGLTGSIGMGKSTTARLFAELGCAVWDADASVHRLYDRGGAAVGAIEAAFPGAITDGTVDRSKLRGIIQSDPTALGKIESIVHPLVAQDRADFIQNAKQDIIVLDIPLLFETGGNTAMDAVVCVSVSPETQEKRVLDRDTMSREQFLAIRAKQMPNDEKCELSDFVVETDTLDHAKEQVGAIVAQIRDQLANA